MNKPELEALLEELDEALVNFPSPIHQATYLLPRTLDRMFGK